MQEKSHYYRKCKCCKGIIKVNPEDIRDIVYFQNFYYHKSCFETTAAAKASSSRGKPKMWKEALDHISEHETEAQKLLGHYIARDRLNDWLLANYDVIAIPKRFWNIIEELGNGVYNKKRCKPVEIDTLYGCWKWGQDKLDKIAMKNKANNKGPKSDDERLLYDLAILLQHINDFIKFKHREMAEKEEQEKIIKSMKTQSKIDYTSLGKATNKDVENDIDDMDSLLDKIF